MRRSSLAGVRAGDISGPVRPVGPRCRRRALAVVRCEPSRCGIAPVLTVALWHCDGCRPEPEAGFGWRAGLPGLVFLAECPWSAQPWALRQGALEHVRKHRDLRHRTHGTVLTAPYSRHRTQPLSTSWLLALWITLARTENLGGAGDFLSTGCGFSLRVVNRCFAFTIQLVHKAGHTGTRRVVHALHSQTHRLCTDLCGQPSTP
jgi:hypothetical protein